MPSSVKICLCLTLGLVAASNPCQSDNGTLSDTCSDEATHFLQIGGHASSVKRGSGSMDIFASHQTSTLTATKPVDCAKINKPLQVLIDGKPSDATKYSFKQLNVKTGKYDMMFEMPFDKVDPKYDQLGGCGINPKDSIMYCAMHSKGTYVVRIDKDGFEFVARLPYYKYNSGDFSPSGTFFVGTYWGKFLAVHNLHLAKGFPDKERNSKDILDLRKKVREKPKGWGHAADVAVLQANLQGNGFEEYLFMMYGAQLNIAKYDNKTDKFSESWVMKVNPGRGDNIFGAAWNFQNQIFFSANNGKGVYTVPYEKLDLTKPLPKDFTLDITKIGISDKAESNDGFSCLTDPSPWVTELQPFDCEKYPGPLQAMVKDPAAGDGVGYDIKEVDFKTGATKLVYSVKQSRTKPGYRFLNGLGISPVDSVVYATMVLDGWDNKKYPTPPPFYIVRIDETNVEYVAKIQAPKGNPIAGGFDGDGNYYIVSNPSLFKAEKVHTMKGFAKPDDKDLPFFDNPKDKEISIVIEDMGVGQLADVTALTANFDGKGNATWVLGLNAYLQLFVAKVDGRKGQGWVIRTDDPLPDKKYEKARQNMGAAWYLNGDVVFGSNDGEGVFKIPLDKIKVPDLPAIKLEKVGKSPPIHDNDGLHCLKANSPFFGRGTW